jgi:NADH-quinone oxidoreductase subunit G
MLQDFTFKFGKATSRMIDEKYTPPNKDYIGENITLFTDRCVMCSRCVRFTREISGTAELQIISRGHHAEIDIFEGDPVNNKLAGNVVDLCPVGALCSKDFLYKQRVWFLKSQKSVCAGCSTGCSIFVDHNKDIVYRLRPRPNPLAQGDFMCDEGRFDYRYVNDRARIDQPLFKKDGKQAATSWEQMIPALRGDIRKEARNNPAAIGAVLSPFLTVEEAYLLAKLFKDAAPKAKLYLGYVPVVGEDDHYPQDRSGKPMQPVRFTIRAEKCPNRRGVEEVLRKFQGDVQTFEQAAQAAEHGQLQLLYVTGGYSPRLGTWASEGQVAALAKVPKLIVQDLFVSELSEAAAHVLPAASFAEKDGTFVNHANLAQAIQWAVRPGSIGRTDGQIFLDLLERRGLLHAETIRKELAGEVPYFKPLEKDLGEFGIRLS